MYCIKCECLNSHEPKLSANNFSIHVVPLVVTYGSPEAIVIDLYPPLKILLPSHQSERGASAWLKIIQLTSALNTQGNIRHKHTVHLQTDF